MRRQALLLLLGLVGPMAGAAPIFRCGNTYSQTPCIGGRLLDSTDPRSGAQRAEAARVAERGRTNAERLERERREREAAKKPASATGFDSRASEVAQMTEAKAPKRKPSRRKGAKDDADSAQGSKDFVAVEPRKRP